MSLGQKLAELDGFINDFLKEYFPGENIKLIKPYLINYIKKDKNVIAFSGETSAETEFAIEFFIKKACNKYYEQVMAYKASYFNEEDSELSFNNLIDNVLDGFFNSMEFYLDEFLAEKFPNQTLFLEKSTMLKGFLTARREFIRNKLLENISKNREQIGLSLRNDEDVKDHAKLPLTYYSPYNLEDLCYSEELIEGFAKFGFFTVLKNILDADINLKDLTYFELSTLEKDLLQSKNELSELHERAEQLAIAQPIKYRGNSGKETVSFFNFLKILLEKINNFLFSQQKPGQQLYSTSTPSTSSFFKPTYLASKQLTLNDSLNLDRLSCGP